MTRRATRNAPGSGTIRQRKNGTWEARYTTGRDPGTGKQVQKSVYGKTQAKVAQKMRKATHELDEGIYMEPARITVGAWFNTWLAEYVGAVKPSTVEQYRYQIIHHIRPALGAVKLGALTAPMIQALYNKRLQQGLSPKSVRNLHGVMRRGLGKAVELGYIRANPSLVCALPRVEKKEIQPIEGEHIRYFLQEIQGQPYEDVLFVTVFSGMRQGEVLGLTWDAVDLDRGTITVNKQLQKRRQVGGGGEYRLVSLKNDKQRTLTVAAEVIATLRQVKREQAAARLLAGDAWDDPFNLVFTNEVGRYLCAYTVYRNFKRIAEKIGIPATRFHDLRHTYATISLQNGDDIKTVSENLGACHCGLHAGRLRACHREDETGQCRPHAGFH